MKKYRTTVGLEIHAELKTRSKMFCACVNDAHETRPNHNICPVCMGHPGTLPVINKAAVRHVLRVGAAVGGALEFNFTEFDRKNYFYPDIPKGYQLSQYKYPLVVGGSVCGVPLTRIHLEEDTAASGHDEGNYSLVDFNRAGVPLMELVTEPLITTPEQASAFGKELQLLLRYLGVSDANMEKGEMRVEANISVAEDLGTDERGYPKVFGTKVEVKNLNSFKAVERAIAYEVERHTGLIERGEKIIQETRGWDEVGQKTFSQRKKENSHDYRYFPDPDLPKLVLKEVPGFAIDDIMSSLPELPQAKRNRLKTEYGIKDADIEVLVSEPVLAQFFEHVALVLEDKKDMIALAANYILSDFMSHIKKSDLPLDEAIARLAFSAKDFAGLIRMVATNVVSSRGAKDILVIMVSLGGNPETIATEKGLKQVSDTGSMEKIAKEVIESHPNVVAEYKAGKEASLQFLVGQGMKVSKGSANPGVLRDTIKKIIG
jgi:aspartyl-tRNA(Asn)/glutamyl-tRNA(Gln) amidotransferase subunit B